MRAGVKTRPFTLEVPVASDVVFCQGLEMDVETGFHRAAVGVTQTVWDCPP